MSIIIGDDSKDGVATEKVVLNEVDDSGMWESCGSGQLLIFLGPNNPKMSQKLHTSAPYLSFVSLRKYLVRKNLLFVPQPDSLSWE